MRGWVDIAAALLTLTPAAVSAQQPAPPPPAPAAIRAEAPRVPEVEYINLIASSTLPPDFTRHSARRLVVLADQLAFGPDDTYTFAPTTKSVVIVGNTMRFTGETTFNLEGTNGSYELHTPGYTKVAPESLRYGGSLTLAARHVIFGPIEEIRIKATGAPPLYLVDRYAVTGAAGGNFTLMYGRLDASEAKAFASDQVTGLWEEGLKDIDSEPEQDREPDAKDRALRVEMCDDILSFFSLDVPLGPRAMAECRELMAMPLRTKAEQRTAYFRFRDFLQMALSELSDETIANLVFMTELHGGESRRFGGTTDGSAGRDGTRTFRAFDLSPADLEMQEVLSEWAIAYFGHLQLQIADAERTQDRGRLLSIFRRFVTFPSVTIGGRHQPRYTALVREIGASRTRLIPAVSVTRSTVLTGAAPRPVTLLSYGTELDTYLAPTTVVIDAYRRANGSLAAGHIIVDPAGTGVRVQFVGRLAVDPWVASAAKTAIEKEGGRFAGTFARYEVSGVTAMVDNHPCRVSALLDRLAFDCAIPTADLNVALAHLASRHGIPVTLRWQYTGDRSISDTFSGLSVSLTRLSETGLTVAGGRISNTGTLPMIVEYLATGTEFVAAAFEVPAGATQALALPADVDPLKVSAPRLGSIYSLQGNPVPLFDVANGTEHVVELTIANYLTVADVPDAPIEHCEVHVEILDGATVVWRTTMPLLPSPHRESRAVISFVRPSRGALTARVESHVSLQGGGRVDLRPITVDLGPLPQLGMTSKIVSLTKDQIR